MLTVLSRAFSVVFLCALFLLARTLPVTGQAPAMTVLLQAFENQTGDRNIDWIGEGLATLIAERLETASSLYVFSRDERASALDRLGLPADAPISRATALKMAWDIGADIVITGRFFGAANDFHAEARILNIERATSLVPTVVDGKLEDVLSLGNTLANEMALLLAPGSAAPDSDYTLRPPVPRSAFEAFVRGLLTQDQQRRLELLNDAVRLHPRYATAVYELGRLHYQDMNYAESTSLLEKVPAGAIEYAGSRFTLGVGYFHLGEYGKAETVLSSLPPVYEVLVNLGAVLAAKGNNAGAQSAWEQAEVRDPLGSEAPFNRAYLALLTGDVQTARRGMEQFLLLHGRDAEAYFALGKALEGLGLAADAQRYIAQAMRLAPRIERWPESPLPPLLRVRNEWNAAGLLSPADTDLWTESRLSRRATGQDLEAWLEAVRTRIDSQLFSDTLRELREISRVFPMSGEVSLLLGYVYERRGQYDLAGREYALSARLQPSAEAYLALARLHRAQNQFALAIEAVDNALRVEPTSTVAATLRRDLTRTAPAASSR